MSNEGDAEWNDPNLTKEEADWFVRVFDAALEDQMKKKTKKPPKGGGY